LISWTLTTDGQYSATSAYEIQFLGRVERNELAKTWKIKAEGKNQIQHVAHHSEQIVGHRQASQEGVATR
jgi:hypothetical protein